MKIRLVLIFTIISIYTNGQVFSSEKSKKKLHDNLIERISDDSLHSTFLITISKSVPLHYHKYHTENVVIVQGKGIMKLGSDTLIIQRGDQITIPKGIPHEVIKVSSRKPLKVFSIQSPRFDGSDRFLVKP